MMPRSIRARWPLAVLLLPVLLAGCTVYPAGPDSHVTTPPSVFDRAWAAVLGAFEDQSVRVTREDREAGVVQGRRGDIDLTATISMQPDGAVRAEFSASGSPNRGHDLIARVSRAYQRRMGL
jgi:hypothetical protein